MACRTLFILWFCLLFLGAQGCAANNRYNFSRSIPDLKMSAPRGTVVAVATLDQRSAVVSGEVPPTDVGVQRGSFGHPFRVETESGLPLADDITTAVSGSLARRGFSAIPVYVTFDKSEAAAMQELAGRNPGRSILILLKRWGSETYTNIGLEYNLQLKVMGPDRTILAESSVAGKETIPGSDWNPMEAAGKQVPDALKQVLENLLNEPKVLEALK